MIILFEQPTVPIVAYYDNSTDTNELRMDSLSGRSIAASFTVLAPTSVPLTQLLLLLHHP